MTIRVLLLWTASVVLAGCVQVTGQPWSPEAPPAQEESADVAALPPLQDPNGPQAGAALPPVPPRKPLFGIGELSSAGSQDTIRIDPELEALLFPQGGTAPRPSGLEPARPRDEALPPPAEAGSDRVEPVAPQIEGSGILRDYGAVKLTEANLIGMEPGDAMGLLGVPEQIREVPPAQIWAYSRDGCRLELFFYLDLASDILRSLTYQLEAGEPSEAGKPTEEARQACLTRLLTPEGEHG